MLEVHNIEYIGSTTVKLRSFIVVAKDQQMQPEPLGLKHTLTSLEHYASLFLSQSKAEHIIEKWLFPLSPGAMFKINKVYIDEKTSRCFNIVDY